MMRLLTAALLLTAAARADSPDFVVRTISGKQHRGRVVKLDGWTLYHGKGAGRRLPPGEWLSLRRANIPLPEFPTDDHLVLGNGDRVVVQDLRLDDEKLHFRHKDLGGGKEVSVPLSTVALIWRLPPDGVVSGEKLRHRLLRERRPRDIVLLRNGDALEGTLQAVKGGQVELEANKKIVTARWPQVAAVALSTELLDRLRPRGTSARVVLTGSGSRLTLSEAACDGTTLEGKTSFGATLRVPLERIAALEPASETVVPLSDLTPSRYDYLPYLDEKWLWSADMTVTGRDLRVAGSTHDRGIGLHAHARLSYALSGRYRHFEAIVGLDDRDGKKGEVKLRVLVDGKPADLGKKDTLTHSDGALLVYVDVAGAKELTLEALPATRGPVQAVVNWVDARLLK